MSVMVLRNPPPANDPPPSPWELVNRAEKVRTLVAHLDAWLCRASFNPYTTAQYVVRVLEAADDAAWEAFAVQAKVTRPSAATRAAVLSVFHERVRLLAGAGR